MNSPIFEAPGLEALAEMLPAYDFEAFIAQGGMGAVYKARQRSLERDVAIKILPRELGEDPDFRASFATEARAMARLNHPNLIGVYDSGDVDGMPYIVMEFVNGKSLYHSAYNLSVEPMQAAAIVKGICEGLAHAHENGVIHRDIKPANILLTPKTEPKIGDFGLAHAGEGPGVMMGTPGYTAPEVMSHPELADRRSDIYSVGVILYELLTGRQAPQQGAVPAPSSVSSCDPTLDPICLKATNFDPAHRYQDAHEMAVALDTWMRQLAASALAAPRRPHHDGGPLRPPPVGGPKAPMVYVKPKKDATAPLKSVLVVVIILVVGYVAWTQINAAVDRSNQSREDTKREAAAKKEQEEKDAQAVADREQEARKQALAKANADPLANETPLESLERLKPALAAGQRDKMPKGIFVQRGAVTLLIPTPMSWRQARTFAEEHGAYLATTLGDADLPAFNALAKASKLWVGAVRTGKDWTLVDGRKWDSSKEPSGLGEFVAVDDFGLSALDDKEELPFLIQWQPDRLNPGSLEAILQRTAASLVSPQSIYPPGTWSAGERHIWAACRSVTQAEAAALARLGGGHLAVPAAEDEATWLMDHVIRRQTLDGYWLGGENKGETWTWTTREPWSAAKWAPGYPAGAGTGLALVPNKGWENVDPEAKLEGLLIEWSTDDDSVKASGGGDDASGSVAGQDGGASLTGPALELRQKAKELLGKYDAARQKALNENAASFKWDLDGWQRGLAKAEAQRWKPDVDALKAKVDGNRLPAINGAAEAADDGARLSEDMAKIAKRCLEKQAAVDTEFKTKAGVVRDAYVKNLEKAQTSATAADKASLVRAINEASSLDAWLAKLGFNSVRAAVESGAKPSPRAEAPKTGETSKTDASADPVVGHWTFQTGIKVAVNADHTVNNGETNGEWVLVSGSMTPRRYEFHWPTGGWDKLVLSPQGRVLDGTNSFTAGGGGPSGGIKNDPDPAHPWDKEPVLGTWTFKDGREITLKGDGTAAHANDNSGTWTLTSGDKLSRTYKIWWKTGWDEVTLSTDGKHLDGHNLKKAPSNGTRS